MRFGYKRILAISGSYFSKNKIIMLQNNSKLLTEVCMLEIYQYICFASIIIIIINVWGFYSFVASKENVNISIYSWCYRQQN